MQTGRDKASRFGTISAHEADKWGLVSRVVEDGEGEVVKEAIAMAKEISSKSQLAVQTGKEVVNAGEGPFYKIRFYSEPLSPAFEMTLGEGLRFERRTFHALFASKDQKEGNKQSFS